MRRADVQSFIRRNGLSLLLLVGVLGWVGYRQLPLFLEARGLVGTPVPSVSVRALDGGAVAGLSSFKGKPVLLNFWATWCAPCIAEVPLINAAHDRWKERGFSILAITNEEEATVRAFQERYGVRYPVYLDPSGEAGRALRVGVFPTLVFVDRDGKIVDISHGFTPLLQWKVRRLVTGSLL